MNRPPLSYVPLLPVLAGVVSGIICCRYLHAEVILTVGILLVIAIVLLILRQKVALEFTLAVSMGVVVTYVSMPVQLGNLPKGDTVITGLVTDVNYYPDYQQFKVNIKGDNGDYSMLVTYAVFEPQIKAGDIVSLTGTYSLPRDETDLPLESDKAEYYYVNGISLLCYVPKGGLNVIGHHDNLLTLCRNRQAMLVDKICASRLNENTSAFLAAILLGDDSLVSNDLRSDYATAGVAHLLALSGAHVAVFTLVIAFILFPIAIAGHRRLRWWITIIILWGYALLTGLSPSVCRAVIMSTAVLLALIFDRPKSSLNSLCLAAILILLYSPLSLFKTGFQLSFMATLSIILISNRLMPVDNPTKGHPRLWGLITVTFAATAGTLPIVICRYHTVPVYFLIANIVAVFVMPVLIGFGIIFVLLLLGGHEPGWIVWLLDNLYTFFDNIVTWVGHLPCASISGIYVSSWLVVPMYLILAFFVAFIYLKQRVYMLLTAATLVFTILTIVTMKPEYANGEAYMLRSTNTTTVVRHHNDTLYIHTSSPKYNFSVDSIRLADRLRYYLATRKIKSVEVQDLGHNPFVNSNGIIPFGKKKMLIAYLLTRVRNHQPSADTSGYKTHNNSADNIQQEYSIEHADYCLLTSAWHGDPVSLYRSINADTIVLSNDINRRRRLRYNKELTEAGIPVIDLGERPLMSY